MKTHKGLDVELEFHEQDPDDTRGLDKGFVVRTVRAMLDGEMIGYLKISYSPSDRQQEFFPTPWHYLRAKGTCFDPDDLLDTWFQAHWHADVVPHSLKGQVRIRSLSRKMAPDEETMRADLKVLETTPCRGFFNRGQTVHDMYAEFVRDIVDRPFVDFIKVEEPYRRQGLAVLLYTEGAKWMARGFGFPLHASGVQSDSAGATWEHMAGSGLYPIDLRKRPWDDKQVYVLDYTGSNASEDHGHGTSTPSHRGLRNTQPNRAVGPLHAP